LSELGFYDNCIEAKEAEGVGWLDRGKREEVKEED